METPETTAATEGNGATPPAGSGKPSFEERLRTDPDFAQDQYTKMKSENTKLFQKMQKYESLIPIADQLGGAEATSRAIYEYDAVMKHPDVKKIVEHYRSNGALPTAMPRTDETDPIYEDPQETQLKAIRQEMDELRGKFSMTQGQLGKQNVMGHLTQLREEFPDGFDEYIRPMIDQKFEEWEKTPHGRELLSTLTYDNLKTVAGRALAEHVDEIGEKRYLRKLEEKRRTTTGVGAPNLSTGKEPSPQRGHTTGYDAWQEFKRREGL